MQAAAELLPIFSMHWVTIQQLYRDTEAGKAGLGVARGPQHGQPRPRYDHGKAAIQPRHGPRHGRPRVAWLAKGRDTKNYIVAERGGRGGALGRDTKL